MLEVLTYIGTSDASALLIGVGTAGTSARAELAKELGVGTQRREF